MDSRLDALREALGEISDLQQTQALVDWDQQVCMPPGGSEARGYLFSTLANLEHGMWLAPALDRLLADAEKAVASLDAESDEACLVRVTRRQQQKQTRVPSKWVTEFALETALAQDVWVRARAESNFKLFQPHLERIVELRQEYTQFFSPWQHIYDPLLDDFETGMKTAEVEEIFNVLRSEQVALVKSIAEKAQPDQSFLRKTYAVDKQSEFGIEVVRRMGFDFEKGRIDQSAHPFTTTIGFGDTRITTHFDPNDITKALGGNMHEAGHALYDLGFPAAFARTPLFGTSSMAVHESQSRMWENQVGLSKPFWSYTFPILKQTFPEQLKGVDEEVFYRAINAVEPTLIRIQADEATYNLHIMLRLELEIGLIEGKLAVADLPQIWNERMQAYLGITPSDDAHGVLQDIHWSGGMFGYFPTYALGNLVSVQFWEKIRQDIPDLDAQFARGEFSGLLGWLREHVHRHGAKFTPQELVRRVTGTSIDPQPYLRYLRSKFGALYGL